jgi:small subunit ribosomal protein S2
MYNIGVKMEHYVSIESLLEAGAHFGHLTRRWNPKMSKFIFGQKNGIHIIDLRKTQLLIDLARNAVYDLATQGKSILFVGTKSQAKNVIEQEAKRSNSNYVSERWLGGMLTNFITIRKSIKRLNMIDKMETDGTFDRLTKKERLMLNRERDRLRKVFGGIETMNRIPNALFVVDIKKEHIALKEAKVLGIPIIGFVDTNTDPDLVDFPIPSNDDSVKAIDLITKVISDAIIEGSSLSRIRQAELEATGDRLIKEQELEGDNAVKVQRKFRERKHQTKSSELEDNENNDTRTDESSIAGSNE